VKGYSVVKFSLELRRWYFQLKIKGVNTEFGCFKTKEEAEVEFVTTLIRLRDGLLDIPEGYKV
jgi:hypothetical protein